MCILDSHDICMWYLGLKRKATVCDSSASMNLKAIRGRGLHSKDGGRIRLSLCSGLFKYLALSILNSLLMRDPALTVSGEPE